MITREADYAIRTLYRLAVEGEHGILSTTFLAKDMAIPYRFLRQILLKLAAEGFVVTVRGKQGGMRLMKSADTITLLDVLCAISNAAVTLNECLDDETICRRTGRCVVQNELKRIQDEFRQRLSVVSLAMLVEQERIRVEPLENQHD